MTPCAIRNNIKTEAAKSAPTYVGISDITDANVEQVRLSVYCDGIFVYVIC